MGKRSRSRSPKDKKDKKHRKRSSSSESSQSRDKRRARKEKDQVKESRRSPTFKTGVETRSKKLISFGILRECLF